MNKVKFSQVAIGAIFWFNGNRMKKNKPGTAIIINKDDKHMGWTHMGINDLCELEKA